VARKIEMPSEEKANLLLEAVEDRKAIDPKLLDLRGKTVLADFFLICSGTSIPHIKAISEKVQEIADDNRLPTPKMAGEQVNEWVLLDFGDVVLHIMGEEQRERYKLEEFWSTPQPKGALPPMPGSVSEEDAESEEDDGDWDDEEDDLEDDEAFFNEADQKVEPIDEDDLDNEEDSVKK
jgi:ribosome-associated protein